MPPSSVSLVTNPLIPLHATHNNEVPLVCIPGAGASVTAFNEFTGALGERWPIYGLQPRGIDLLERPHESVEDAALYNLSALAQLGANRPIHLLGHSHGGLVAFEMALRLQQQGRSVASLTLIDTEPPIEETEKRERHIGTPDIFRKFTEAFESIFDKTFALDEGIISSGQVQPFVDDLHVALVRAKCLPARSASGMLYGPLATFTAACRTTYVPTRAYVNKMHLALASTKLLSQRCPRPENQTLREAQVKRWRQRASDLNVWHGPGHHFSILQTPNVISLANWWTRTRDTRATPAQPDSFPPHL